MHKLKLWDSHDEAEAELTKRWMYAKAARTYLELDWQMCERAVYSTNGTDLFAPALEHKMASQDGTTDENPERIAVNYVLKDIRLLHSQLSLNPPVVSPRPQTNDVEDVARADAADRLIRYGVRQYNFQDTTDLVSLSTLIYGTGVAMAYWNPDAGEPVSFDPETGDVVMTGDFEYRPENIWHIYPEPGARRPQELRWLFKEFFMPYEDACARWGGNKEMADKLKEARLQETSVSTSTTVLQGRSGLPQYQYDVVRVVQYWEKGLAVNGLKGRFAWGLLTKSGDKFILLDEVSENPHQVSRPLQAGEKPTNNKFRPVTAALPFHFFTDIDVPGSIWGKSIVSYAVKLQNTVNNIDSVTLDVIKAHGIARLVIDDSCNIAEDSVSNSTWDICRIHRENPNAPMPTFMPPMPLPEGVNMFRDRIRGGIDDVFGVNEAMFGQSSRETAAVTMQLAQQQGNMIRRRLFNKYATFVEDVYRSYLNVVRMNWTTPRTISVLGKEKAFESADFSGADIDGGFDFTVEYGASLALDPISRRQEIMTMLPILEKANIPMRAILRHVRLNELEALYDMSQLGADRQKEIFDEMRATGKYIAPRELQDHASMLEYAYGFIMSAAFKYWPENVKSLVEQHIKEREELAKTQATGGAATPPPDQLAAGGPAPANNPAAPATPGSLGDLLEQL